MREQQTNAAHRIVARAFEIIVRLWPAGSRDWARAMQAELPEIMDANESLKWLAGGMMSLTHAWWNRILFGRGAQLDAPAPVKSPGAWPVAVLLLALAACALPAMRQGMSTIFAAWKGFNAGITDAQLQRMGREAEQDRDAKMLAFVAMKLPVTQQSLHWADLAVSLDPSLTWVYMEMQEYPLDRRMSQADFSQRVARLEQWDPDNAVPYLLEAGRVFEQFEMDNHYQTTAMANYYDYLAKNPVWSAAMDKAFRAARFDDYSKRRFELNLTVMREHKIDNPMSLLFSVYSTPIPNLMAIRVYGHGLIREGERRETGSDFAGATQLYWRVADFSQQMELGSRDTTIERLIALSMVRESFEKLQGVLQRSGRGDEARFAAYEVENARAIVDGIAAENHRSYSEQKAALWEPLTLHASALAIIVAAIFSSATLLWLSFGFRSGEKPRPTLRRWLCAISQCSAALLAFAVAFFLINYVPYLVMYRDMSAMNSESLRRTFGGLLEVAVFAFPSSNPEMGVYYWSGFSALCSAIVLTLIARMVLRALMEKTPA